MFVQIDTREKDQAIRGILRTFKAQGVGFCRSKLYVGDYVNLHNPLVVIDRKHNLSELYSNLCHDRARFENELDRARIAGIKLVLLCEHGGDVATLDDVKSWYNPQLDKGPYAWDGYRLHKELCRIASKYDVDVQFCKKSETGMVILGLLSDPREAPIEEAASGYF